MKLLCSVFCINIFFAIFNDVILCQSVDYTVCGKRQQHEKNTDFIFKDSDTRNPPGSWPWVVSMGEKSSVKIWSHRCGGSLVTTGLVLTAAHCALDLDSKIKKGDIFIRAGDGHLQDAKDDKDVEEVEVVDYEVHPNYKRGAHYSDIAVLQLAHPVSLSAAIRTVCLPTKVTLRQQDDNLPLIVTGWGADDQDQSGKSLFDAFVQVYSETSCNNTHEGKRRSELAVPFGFSSDLLCGGDPAGSEGVCLGDSGSPAVFFQDVQRSYVLRAIVSGGLTCGTQEHPNIYVRISDSIILHWIYGQIRRELVTSSPTIPETDRSCPGLDTCETMETCPYIQNKYKEAHQAATTEKRKKITSFLKSLVCDKQRKAFCCPVPGSGCKVIEGAAAGKSCIFPFKWSAKTYNECAYEPSKGDEYPWCSTKVDDSGTHVSGGGHWGKCDPDKCPGAGQSILIESTGGAAENQGSNMGYFDRIERMENQRPVYSQRAGSVFLYHHQDTGSWRVVSPVGSYTAYLMVPSTNLIPPTEGWHYWDGSKFHTDSTLLLTISPPDPSSVCTSIQVSSTGPAGTAQSSRMGSYRWEGEWLNGHKVFVGGRGNNMYLRIRTGGTSWSISDTKDSYEGGIQSGRATGCPCRGAGPSSRVGWDGWRYGDGVNWLEDESIQVTR